MQASWMATPIALYNIARFCAGAVALLWSLLGLGDALAALTTQHIDVLIAAALVVNTALAISAILAFVNARRWRPAMIGNIAAVTIVRILPAFPTHDYLSVAVSVAMLVAIVGIVAAARPA